MTKTLCETVQAATQAKDQRHCPQLLLNKNHEVDQWIRITTFILCEYKQVLRRIIQASEKHDKKHCR